MKIYTKTGDQGETGLFGGARVKKDDARVEAYGTIDEVNAAVGLARAHGPTQQTDDVLAAVQDDLFTLGSELACAPGKEDKLKLALLAEKDVERLEKAIDAAVDGLPELQSFVLPGGSLVAAKLHLARTVTRRAERLLVTIGVRGELLRYVNRLSDLLFVLARRENFEVGVPDVPWRAR